MSGIDLTQIEYFLQTLQSSICGAMEALDTQVHFSVEPWEREEGGGGITRILQNGHYLAKAGVNFSAVHGELPQNVQHALKVQTKDFYATGLSIVMHPVNPWVPIIHMNIRYFQLHGGDWWFGGGIDLTPHYVLEEDAVLFHQKLKEVCDRAHPDFYPKYKHWADEYFYIQHRQETRGVGGIFFDRLNEQSTSLTGPQLFDFWKSIGEAFAPMYTQFIQRNADKPYGPEQLLWQNYRRSRYVEFNLVYDKGTKFGLDTHGRIESILMSMPPVAQWLYDPHFHEGSAEHHTLSLLRKGIDWVTY